MESKRVSLPLIHEHPLVLWYDLRRGDCCGRFEAICDGYFCKLCDFFVHKKCGDSSGYIQHPSHLGHTLRLQSAPNYKCVLCRGRIVNLCYRCDDCRGFIVDLYCANYPPLDVVENSDRHCHKLTLVKKLIWFDCDNKCGKNGYGFPYKCFECNLSFHVDCVRHPSKVKHLAEVNHSYHSLHTLKLLTGQSPEYSDGKCSLCERNIDVIFYHCSSCKFNLDMRCVLHPPPQSLLDLKAHDHQLTLLPRLDSFTCNACGLKGDRSPYVCFHCGFMIHQDCLGLPRLININRHDHRVARTSVIGVLNSVCGVCRQKVDWSCGGYACQRCTDYVVHSKCATNKNVWNGKELEDEPEETKDIEPYMVIDDNLIHHFSHTVHYLRLKDNGLLCEDKKRCNACTNLIGLQSFYGCVTCGFNLHKNCAELPTRKWHVLHNERLTLVTNKSSLFMCGACDRLCNGFSYQQGNKMLDVLCGSISEPFFHPSHPNHPLYYILRDEKEICNGCNLEESHVLRCIEVGCGFVLGFKCATLPQKVKHRVDDHPLSLCYGEKANGKYWCDICEKETNPETWFYTCKDNRASLHTECVVGDFGWLMPGSRIDLWGNSFEVELNNSSSRPICRWCNSHCIYPINFKLLGTSSSTYFCFFKCMESFYRAGKGNVIQSANPKLFPLGSLDSLLEYIISSLS